MSVSGVLLIFSLAFIATNSYGGNCYHKVGSLCKGGYTSGYLSDCSTPCTTGVVDTPNNNQGMANYKEKTKANETSVAIVNRIPEKKVEKPE